MNRLHILAVTAAALCAPAPLLAQAAPAAVEQADPARLAAATATVGYVWPIGTYARLMKSSMDGLMNQMMGAMFDMPIGDIAGPIAEEAGKPLDPDIAATSIREVAKAADPHFEERTRLTMGVMMDEMTEVMATLEPRIREGLARAYAGRFTLAQLKDMNAFFATPSGTAYSRDAMLIMTDPEVMKEMVSAMPELMKAMPGIIQKATEATAHLPPPPKPEPHVISIEYIPDDEESPTPE